MVKCLPEFEYFYWQAFLKDENIIFKIRRSKVTDYAALMKPLSHRLITSYYSHAVTCYLRDNMDLTTPSSNFTPVPVQ